MKKLLSISMAITFSAQVFAAPIVISNQSAATSSIRISNQPDQTQHAFTVFENGYTQLMALLAINTGKTYFTHVTLTSPATKTITLDATSAWETETDATKTSILTSVQSLWDDALGNTSGNLVVHITQ